MRKVLASLVATVFAVTLFIPLLAGVESTLPACCRRDGKHHCSMTAKKAHEHTGPAMKAAPKRCSQFPVAGTPTVEAKGTPPPSAGAFFAALVSHPAVHPQTQARQRISLTRSEQKRGPPLS